MQTVLATYQKTTAGRIESTSHSLSIAQIAIRLNGIAKNSKRQITEADINRFFEIAAGQSWYLSLIWPPEEQPYTIHCAYKYQQSTNRLTKVDSLKQDNFTGLKVTLHNKLQQPNDTGVILFKSPHNQIQELHVLANREQVLNFYRLEGYPESDWTLGREPEVPSFEPQTPQTPAQPEQPTRPTSPQQPKQPVTAEQPTRPASPQQPKQPTHPQQPKQISQPHTPSELGPPSNYDTPRAPQQRPVSPITPSSPRSPTTKGVPTTPATPHGINHPKTIISNDNSDAAVYVLLIPTTVEDDQSLLSKLNKSLKQSGSGGRKSQDGTIGVWVSDPIGKGKVLPALQAENGKQAMGIHFPTVVLSNTGGRPISVVTLAQAATGAPTISSQTVTSIEPHETKHCRYDAAHGGQLMLTGEKTAYRNLLIQLPPAVSLSVWAENGVLTVETASNYDTPSWHKFQQEKINNGAIVIYANQDQ